MNDPKEIQRILLEAQEADRRAAWAVAAVTWETRQLEARNEAIERALAEMGKKQ